MDLWDGDMGVDDAEADQRNQKYGRIAQKRGPRGDSILALNLARPTPKTDPKHKAPNEHKTPLPQKPNALSIAIAPGQTSTSSRFIRAHRLL